MMTFKISYFALLLLLASGLLAAQGHEEAKTMAIAPGGVLTPIEAVIAGPARLQVSMFPDQAAIPRMSEFTLQAIDENGQPITHVSYEVKFVQTEDEFSMFETTLHDHEGKAELAYAFNDGAEHRMEVTMRALPTSSVPFEPVKASYLIEIIPQQPPLQLMVREMVNLFIFFGIGALLGRWYGGMQQKPHHAKA
jgi:hypothetical protein